jgi:hypothetical protein
MSRANEMSLRVKEARPPDLLIIDELIKGRRGPDHTQKSTETPDFCI